jgi:iron complex transport system permease protein
VKKPLVLFALLALALVTLLAAPCIGVKNISPVSIMTAALSGTEAEIFWRIRLPRVLTSFLAGSSLAVCGMVFQALFRNPLATPFTLGVSSGASLGAALYIQLGTAFSFLGLSGVSLFAFGGAILAITLVYSLSVKKRGLSTGTMLLAGVAINFSFSSFILFIQYISDFANSYRILRWLMGGIEAVGYTPVFNMLPFFLGGSIVLFFLSREMNLISTGEDIATSRGMDVRRTKRVLYFVTSLMVGGVVAFCGPIGFVGMMVPHICRLLIGWNHRYLLPATILFGGMFLTFCDTLARIIIAPAELPVGVITALLGGPFFLWLLLSKKSGEGL